VFLKHKKEDVVSSAGYELGNKLKSWFGERVLGPDKPAVARVKTLFIRRIIIKLEIGIDYKKVRVYLHHAQEQMIKNPRYGVLQIYYDVDPL
jgi:primosomal protein N' (replication factor Y)